MVVACFKLSRAFNISPELTFEVGLTPVSKCSKEQKNLITIHQELPKGSEKWFQGVGELRKLIDNSTIKMVKKKKIKHNNYKKMEEQKEKKKRTPKRFFYKYFTLFVFCFVI